MFELADEENFHAKFYYATSLATISMSLAHVASKHRWKGTWLLLESKTRLRLVEIAVFC